ncbi:MAG: hypothetical protein NW215_09765 [Hyphomicrobiales bacterium]|nr:hypothetical protein [Hyphomicrobiales bacterium]
MSDTATMFIAFYPAAMFIAGLAATIIAPKRGRDQVWWGIFSFLFPPVIVILLLLPHGRNWRTRHQLDDAGAGDDALF